MGRHAAEHLHEIRRLFGGGRADDFEFVRAHARLRAEQRFPLEATLHAYRCGHRVVAKWLREAVEQMPGGAAPEAVTAVADFAIEYTDSISTIIAGEYVSQTRLLAEREGDRRTELLGILLQGYDESDGRVSSILRRAGYLEQRQSFCVLLAQSTDPSEMDNPARAQRLAEAVGRAVESLPIRRLVGIRDNVVTAVFSMTRRMSGWTPAQSLLAQRIFPLLLKLGPAVLVGLSTDQPSTSQIPRGLKEAHIALNFANVTERVVSFSDLPIRRLLLNLGGEHVKSALPQWCHRLRAADKKARGALVDTLRGYAKSDMNVLQAARELGVHPNTIYTRMQKIEDLTGLDGRRYEALTELLLAADLGRD